MSDFIMPPNQTLFFFVKNNINPIVQAGILKKLLKSLRPLLRVNSWNILSTYFQVFGAIQEQSYATSWLDLLNFSSCQTMSHSLLYWLH